MNTITLQAPKHLFHWLRIFKLYRSAFPKEERKPFSTIVKKYRQGIFDVWCICRDGKFSGIATTINHGDLILIDYLAISPACRSQGIGSAALQLLTAIWRFLLMRCWSQSWQTKKMKMNGYSLWKATALTWRTLFGRFSF